eukprot:3302337-Lingulodinium_polyedra.AAC.1
MPRPSVTTKPGTLNLIGLQRALLVLAMLHGRLQPVLLVVLEDKRQLWVIRQTLNPHFGNAAPAPELRVVVPRDALD